MPTTLSSNFLKALISVALCLATFGSFRFAQAITRVKVSNVATMKLPKELGDWKTFESPTDISKADVIARKYMNKAGSMAGVVVRTSPSNAVLHDLTSCLINAQANPVVENDEHIQTHSGTLSASLVSFEMKNAQKLALLWFQAGTQTASNRWSWRLISSTSPAVREAPIYFQAEVTIKSSGDKQTDITHLRELSTCIYEELIHH